MSSKRPIFIIFLTVFIDLVGFGIVIPLHSFLARQFHADALQVGLLMAVYSLMQFIFSPFWGQLSDKYGRRPIILMSLLGAALAHIAFGMAQSYWALFGARIFAGIFGANISAAMAYVADITTKEKRSQTMGLIGAAIGLGFVMGPFIGGVFGQIGLKMGSAPPFGQSFGAIVAGVVCFLNFLFALKYLKESRVLGQVDADQGERSHSLGLGEKLKRIFGHMSEPKVGRLMGMYLICMIAMGHMEVAMFLYVEDKFHWTFDMASYGFAYMGLIMVFTQGYLVRKLLPKWGESRVLILGGVFYSLALLFIALVDQVSQLGIAVTLLGIGIGLTNTSLTGSISISADPQNQGSVMGTTQSLAAIGRILGPFLGAYYYRDISKEAPFLAGSALVLIMVITALVTFKSLPDASKNAKKQSA